MKTKTPNVSGRSAWLRDNITKYFSFSAIIILLVALSLTQDNFLGTSNLKNLLRDTAPLMIMSAGMTMVLLFGSIDLSMGAVCSVSNVTYIHPVSYTHLDVYKRQLPPCPMGAPPPLSRLPAPSASCCWGCFCCPGCWRWTACGWPCRWRSCSPACCRSGSSAASGPTSASAVGISPDTVDAAADGSDGSEAIIKAPGATRRGPLIVLFRR